MDNNESRTVVKPKQPLLAVALSAYLVGLGQIYARRVKRGVGILLASILLGVLTFVLILYIPHFTWPMVIIYYAVIASFGIWVLVDAYRCARQYNRRNNINLQNPWFKRLGLIALIVLVFLSSRTLVKPEYAAALAIRHYFLEAFHVPTGGMAPTVMGHHFHLTCQHCGYDYDYGFVPTKYMWSEGTLPYQSIPLVPQENINRMSLPQCPMCFTPPSVNERYKVISGDRLLVDKTAYRTHDPARWEVVVFKNPSNLTTNFIKRTIGRPCETVELIDGDVYINGKIARKPFDVQNALWRIVWDSSCYTPGEKRVKYPWQPTATESAWRLTSEGNLLTFNGSETADEVAFDEQHLQTHLNGFLPYNGPMNYKVNYYISDMKVSLLVRPQDEQSVLTIALTKYNRSYRVEVHFDGTCLLYDEQQPEPLRQTKLAPFETAPVPIAFAVVDHQMILDVGGNQLLYAGSDDPKAWGYSKAAASSIPQVILTAQGKPFTITHLALYRDVHYTNIDPMGRMGRGTEGNPLILGKNEFFVLGDNSTHSHDSRFWSDPSLSVSGATYPAGVLPRENIIGRAMKIYWPLQRSSPIK